MGKSRRIVIDVDDVELKRRLYSALAENGQSLKDWFVAATTDYLDARARGRQLEFPVWRAAEEPAPYRRRPPAQGERSENRDDPLRRKKP
jgi:hypothetical protein